MFFKSIFNRFQKLFNLSLLSIFLSLAASTPVASQDLGKGFFDYGVAAPISNHRGVVATVDGNGRNVVLLSCNKIQVIIKQ
ncbi:MAG TPA: hypothetical protein DIT07_08190 [Sphingobacteriaceae bacterium]|nr:hypothetical protein [Sphingobacteriaceae bacterium]